MSIRQAVADLGYGLPARLRAICAETGVPSLRGLLLRARAGQYNKPPYPLGLPIDAQNDAVEQPIVTSEPGGRYVAHFRGGILFEPPRPRIG